MAGFVVSWHVICYLSIELVIYLHSHRACICNDVAVCTTHILCNVQWRTLSFPFQLAANNSPELNALGLCYGSGWKVRVPLLQHGGCLCKPTPAEQQRLDKQRQHEEEHPDVESVFNTTDDLALLKKMDREDPIKRRCLNRAYRGAHRQKLVTLRRVYLEWVAQRQAQHRALRH